MSVTPVGIAAPQAAGVEAADQARPVSEYQWDSSRVAEAAQAAAPQVAESDYNAVRTGGASGRRGDLVAAAKKWLGTPYKWGGNGPLGVDCSGFTQQVYRQFGIELPRVSAQQAASGKRIGIDQAQPGDLVAWDNSSRNNGADHIAIYLGDGMVIHAPRPGDSVKISKVWGNPWAVSMGVG